MAEKYYVEVYSNGNTYWYTWPGEEERKLHRLDEYTTGGRTWYQNGVRHRTDGPAIEYPDGYRAWFQNGRLHRTDGPAIEHADGSREWRQNGRLHRTDGPALEGAVGGREWFQNGLRHRMEGPAVEHTDGTYEWWLDGTQYTEDAWRAATQPAVEMTIAEIEAVLGKRIKVVK